MPDVVIIDSDVLVDAGRSISEAVACLESIERQAAPAVSDVTRMELIVGCRRPPYLASQRNGAA